MATSYDLAVAAREIAEAILNKSDRRVPQLTRALLEFRRGDAWHPTHQHHEGGIYQALGVATCPETAEKLTIYRSEGGQWWAIQQDVFARDFAVMPPSRAPPKGPPALAQEQVDVVNNLLTVWRSLPPNSVVLPLNLIKAVRLVEACMVGDAEG